MSTPEVNITVANTTVTQRSDPLSLASPTLLRLWHGRRPLCILPSRMNTPSDRTGTRARLVVLHQKIDAETAPLSALHQSRLSCRRGCSDCCQDDLTVLEVEADRIRRAHPQLLAEGAPHPPGACAFLDAEGACRVYAERPYVCRTQGLPLRWLEEDEDDEIVEQRDICPLNLEGPALEALPEEACYTLGPVELELLALQDEFGASEARVPLRSLFLKGPA